MSYEELFDAYRQVVSQRDQLALAGDALWGVIEEGGSEGETTTQIVTRWEALRGYGTEPPVEDWSAC